MPCKTLLTVITAHAARPAPDLSALDAAIGLARSENAHLEALCIGIDETPYGFFYGDASIAVLQDAPDRALEAARAEEKRLKSRLSREDIRWSVDTALSQQATLSTVVSQRARFSDLVVLSRPYGEGRNPVDVAVLEAALFDADVPVLVLPEGQAIAAEPRRIVVAWNRSPEALSAIRAALPLLIRAQAVDIAIIDPEDYGPERSDPGGALAQWLARHGVRAEISVLARTLPRVSEVLIRHLRDRQADLLVMGAYGHSRFREAILGGATRELLETAPVPVLMAR